MDNLYKKIKETENPLDQFLANQLSGSDHDADDIVTFLAEIIPFYMAQEILEAVAGFIVEDFISQGKLKRVKDKVVWVGGRK